MLMKRLTVMILTAALAVCCAERGLDPARGDDSPGGAPGHGMIVLGRQLDDPYSVENMTKALSAVYPTKAERIALDATHSYVRFLPANEQQYDRLEQLGFDLLDHPMDYEIVKGGDWYHDPSIPEEEFTWQYCVVPKDTFLPPLIPRQGLAGRHSPRGAVPLLHPGRHVPHERGG